MSIFGKEKPTPRQNQDQYIISKEPENEIEQTRPTTAM